MTNFQLYREIIDLPPLQKLDVINYIKKIKGSSTGVFTYELGDYLPPSYLMEPEVTYNVKKSFLDLLLNGPTFTEKQLQKIAESRKLQNV